MDSVVSDCDTNPTLSYFHVASTSESVDYYNWISSAELELNSLQHVINSNFIIFIVFKKAACHKMQTLLSSLYLKQKKVKK